MITSKHSLSFQDNLKARRHPQGVKGRNLIVVLNSGFRIVRNSFNVLVFPNQSRAHLDPMNISSLKAIKHMYVSTEGHRNAHGINDHRPETEVAEQFLTYYNWVNFLSRLDSCAVFHMKLWRIVQPGLLEFRVSSIELHMPAG